MLLMYLVQYLGMLTMLSMRLRTAISVYNNRQYLRRRKNFHAFHSLLHCFFSGALKTATKLLEGGKNYGIWQKPQTFYNLILRFGFQSSVSMLTLGKFWILLTWYSGWAALVLTQSSLSDNIICKNLILWFYEPTVCMSSIGVLV